MAITPPVSAAGDFERTDKVEVGRSGSHLIVEVVQSTVHSTSEWMMVNVGQPARRRSLIKDAEQEGKDAEGKDAGEKVAEGQDDEAGVDHDWFPDEESTENSQKKTSSRSHLAQHCLRNSNITSECASIIQSFANEHREEWEDAQELNFDGTVHSGEGNCGAQNTGLF